MPDLKFGLPIPEIPASARRQAGGVGGIRWGSSSSRPSYTARGGLAGEPALGISRRNEWLDGSQEMCRPLSPKFPLLSVRYGCLVPCDIGWFIFSPTYPAALYSAARVML
jgi:hypothetical protein